MTLAPTTQAGVLITALFLLIIVKKTCMTPKPPVAVGVLPAWEMNAAPFPPKEQQQQLPPSYMAGGYAQPQQQPNAGYPQQQLQQPAYPAQYAQPQQYAQQPQYAQQQQYAPQGYAPQQQQQQYPSNPGYAQY